MNDRPIQPEVLSGGAEPMDADVVSFVERLRAMGVRLLVVDQAGEVAL